MAGQRLLICLSDADYAALKRKAADMQKSAVKLSGQLLQAIISSDIYEAVEGRDYGAVQKMTASTITRPDPARAIRERTGKPAKEKGIEKEAIAGTVPTVAETEIVLEPSVRAFVKAESSAPEEETVGGPENEPIPRLTV